MTSLSSGGAQRRASRVTIREVAQAAGVGTKTVSRVINEEPNVSAETTQRVRAAIAELNWHPDAHAANLRRIDTRTRSLGLLLGSVANPFWATIHRAIEDIAVHRDVAVFASSLDEDAEREVAAVEAFVRRKADGLILTCASPSQQYLSELVPTRVPTIFIDREPRGVSGDVVLSDNRGGAALATRHLLSRGHRRLALLVDRSDIWTAQQRSLGFFDALKEFGVAAQDAVVIDELTSEEAAEEAVLSLFAQPRACTAIFSAQNLITIGAIRALRRLGKSHEIALIGYDDIELGDLLDPPVSVVAQHPSVIGRIAAERIFARLDSNSPIEPTQFQLPVKLIPRGSGEILPPQHGG